jgi:hypothetical protein
MSIAQENGGSQYFTNSWRLLWNSYILYQADKSRDSRICYKNFRLQAANELFQKDYKKIARIGKSNVLVHTQVKIEGKWAKKVNVVESMSFIQVPSIEQFL